MDNDQIQLIIKEMQNLFVDTYEFILEDIMIVRAWVDTYIYPQLQDYIDSLSPHIEYYMENIQKSLISLLISYKKSKFRSRAHLALLYITKSEYKEYIISGIITVLVILITLFFSYFFSYSNKSVKNKMKSFEIISNKRDPSYKSSISSRSIQQLNQQKPLDDTNNNDIAPPIQQPSLTPIVSQDSNSTYISPIKSTEHTTKFSPIMNGNSSLPPGLTDTQQEAFKLITSGTILIKHGRLGTRHIRYVFVSADLLNICWRPIGASIKDISSLPLHSFKSIDIGGQDRTLRCQESCLLSLVGKSDKDRSLHFEFAGHPSLDENIKAASDWGDALGACLVTMRGNRANSRSCLQSTSAIVSPRRASSSRITSPEVSPSSARKRVQSIV